jgi:hypothetical protein
MGSSYTEYKGYGFWARDDGLEVWLRLLVEEIDKSESMPDWLKAARDHWFLQATVGFRGWIHPELDDYLLSQDRVNLVVRLSEDVLKWLGEQDERFSQEYLISLGTSRESWWAAEIEVEIFAQVGRKFIELLRGELKTDASTSPVF